MAQIPISLAQTQHGTATAPRAPLPVALASQECSAWGRGNPSDILKATLSLFRNSLAQGRATSTGSRSRLVLPQQPGLCCPCAPVPSWLWHSSGPCPPASSAPHNLDQPTHIPEGCHRHSSKGLSPRGLGGQTAGLSARMPDLALRMAEWFPCWECWGCLDPQDCTREEMVPFS